MAHDFQSVDQQSLISPFNRNMSPNSTLDKTSNKVNDIVRKMEDQDDDIHEGPKLEGTYVNSHEESVQTSNKKTLCETDEICNRNENQLKTKFVVNSPDQKASSKNFCRLVSYIML